MNSIIKPGKTIDDYQNQNREQKKHQMVAMSHENRKQSGQFQTINNVFARLPLPRIEKNNYRFLFENIKENVESILLQQNHIQNLQIIEQQHIDSIHVKLPKFGRFLQEDQLNQQRLPSTNSLFKTLIYLRNQKEINSNKWEGSQQPFIPDSHFMDLEKSKKDIANIKLFLEQPLQDPYGGGQTSVMSLKRHFFSFTTQNQINFKDKSFPSTMDIHRRATILAKKYLLQLYKQEGRKLLLMDKNQEAELEKKRRLQKMKQQAEIEKTKEGELIEDTDLYKQVSKIMQWIEKKMNALAYEEFRNKNGDRAQEIKKSLEKLKFTISKENTTMTKLKMLINYKYRKGW